MAIKKAKDKHNRGIDIEHWEIIEYSLNFTLGMVVRLQGYVTKAAKTAGKNPAPDTYSFTFSLTELDAGGVNINNVKPNDIYALIKTTPEFTGAIDD